MLATLPAPIFSRVTIAVRQLLLPTLVLASAACDSRDNPTEPIRSQPRPTIALTAPFDPKGQILVTSGSPDNKLFLAGPVTTNVVQLPSGPGAYQVGSWSADYTKIAFSKGLWGGLWPVPASRDAGTGTSVLPNALPNG